MNKLYVRNLNDPLSTLQRVIKSLSNLRASLNMPRESFLFFQLLSVKGVGWVLMASFTFVTNHREKNE